jgi:hypothetical protein
MQGISIHTSLLPQRHKWWYLYANLRGFTSQKARIVTSTIVTTSTTSMSHTLVLTTAITECDDLTFPVPEGSCWLSSEATVTINEVSQTLSDFQRWASYGESLGSASYPELYHSFTMCFTVRHQCLDGLDPIKLCHSCWLKPETLLCMYCFSTTNP